jgi:hypothetical protein
LRAEERALGRVDYAAQDISAAAPLRLPGGRQVHLEAARGIEIGVFLRDLEAALGDITEATPARVGGSEDL